MPRRPISTGEFKRLWVPEMVSGAREQLSLQAKPPRLFINLGPFSCPIVGAHLTRLRGKTITPCRPAVHSP